MGAVAAPSQAAGNNTAQDGLVNVAVGDVTVSPNVAIGVAANLIAQVCGVKVGPLAVLGTAVDATGVPSAPICTGTIGGQSGQITITQATRA